MIGGTEQKGGRVSDENSGVSSDVQTEDLQVNMIR